MKNKSEIEIDKLLLYCSILIFIFALIISVVLGGSAAAGYTFDGHYYLGWKGSDNYVEVSKLRYLFMAYLELSFLVCVIAAIVVGLIKSRRSNRKVK